MRQSGKKQIVYVGIYVPAPDNPPRPREIAWVFADDDMAQAWVREGPMPSINGSYRMVEKHEVEERPE